MLSVHGVEFFTRSKALELQKKKLRHPHIYIYIKRLLQKGCFFLRPSYIPKKTSKKTSEKTPEKNIQNIGVMK